MLTKYQLKKAESNLMYFYNLASESDFKNGVTWYKEAHIFCVNLANEYNTTFEIVANVLSALSPRNKWEQNKKDTIKVFKAINKGQNENDIKVCTFSKNKRKAFKIAKKELLITENSPKTYSFVQNIAFLNDNFVTIDVWHYRASFNKMRIKKALTKLEYYQLEKLTINLAKKTGLKGYEFQAVVWCAIRNNY